MFYTRLDEEEFTEHGAGDVSLDVESRTLTLPDGRGVGFPLDNFSRYCLLNGVDQLGFLMDHAGAIADFEARTS